MRGEGMDDLCDYAWSVNMQVTITCSARTANPTSAPSLAPTSPPTSAPSHAPTSITTIPTNVPSESPTHPTASPSHLPSVHSQPPTDVPSAPPTHPSVTPTVITSHPTPNPTIKTANCSTDRDCWSVNVRPVLHSFVSVPVTVLSGPEFWYDKYYDVTFTINTMECNRPSIDFVFLPTDNSQTNQWLKVSAPGLSAQFCGGSSEYCISCCYWFTCLSQVSVNNDLPIAIGENITVTIMKSSPVYRNFCDSYNDVKAIVTLNCDDSTTSPTSVPSNAPTAAPSGVTTGPTNAPSGSPTLPTDGPSAAPTQPPTNAPSSAPTQPSTAPSGFPTAITSQPTLNPSVAPSYALPVTSSCGTLCTEYHVNIAPKPGVVTSRTIAVRELYPDGAFVSYARILLTPKGHPCTDPIMNATFEVQWYSDGYPDESLTLTGQYGTTTCYQPFDPAIFKCGGSPFQPCLTNQNLGIIEIYPENETQIIQIERGRLVFASCDHDWAVMMDVTITCSARTVNPTNVPTIAPTNVPTSTTNQPTTDPSAAPSVAPSKTPSQAPSLAPSISPTSAPSDVPTAITTVPTNVPSGSPTTPPSRAPSKSPSLAPTSPPTSPPSDAPTSITIIPTNAPSAAPTSSPSHAPSSPSRSPTSITSQPTPNPTI
eukprot:46230_1